MPVDITPLIPSGRKTITGYGAGGFKINGEQQEGSLIVFADSTQEWEVSTPDQMCEASFTPILDRVGDAEIELLIIGTGKTVYPLPKELRSKIRAQGIAMEVMDTGAACRTYNICLSEERRVAAALIAV